MAALVTGPFAPPRPLPGTAKRLLMAGPVIATVRVGRTPFDLAVDAGREHVFVVNAGDNSTSGTVSLLDATTGRLLRTVSLLDATAERLPHRMSLLRATTGRLPRSVPVGLNGLSLAFQQLGLQQAVVVDSRAGRVFVLRSGSTVLLDAASGRVLRVLSIGTLAGGLAVDERTGRAFMNTGRGVSVLDGATGRVLRTIPASGVVLALDGRAGRVVVSDYATVSVLDVGTGRLVHRTALDGGQACWVAADSGAGRAVLAVDKSQPQESGQQPGSEEAWVVDTGSGHVVQRTVLDEWMPLSCAIPTVAVDSVRGRAAVVACPDPNFLHLGACLVTLLDTRNGHILHGVRVGRVLPPNTSNIPSSFVYAGPVAMDTRRGLTFVTTLDPYTKQAPSTVVALDTETGRVRARINVGRSAAALAVDEQRDRLFVANEADNTVSVIDTTHL